MIKKIFIASTANIKKSDSLKLDKEEDFTVAKFPEGYFILLPPKENGLRESHAKYSDAFIKLLLYSWRIDCEYICLDRDVEPVLALEEFNW